MAARLRPRHQDEIREKIRVAQLVKFLEDHALGRKKGGQQVATRLKAAEVLLRKCLPDLSQTELTGKDGQPLFDKVVREVVDPKK